jgi:S1-C subfamily serine protease
MRIDLRSWTILVAVSLAAGPLAGKTLRLKDGAVVTGQITAVAADHVKMQVHGIERTFYNDEILSPGETAPPSSPGAARTAPLSESEAHALFERTAPAVVTVQMFSEDPRASFSCNGFVLRPDGLVATALHCASWFDRIQVRLQNGETYPVSAVAGFDRNKDLCILKIGARKLTALPIGKAAGLRVDRPLYALLISTGGHCRMADGKLLSNRISYGKMAFRCDLPIVHGNSGGPVLDLQGRAVGLNSFIELDAVHYRYFMPLDGAEQMIRESRAMSFSEFRKAARVDGLIDRGSTYLQFKSTDTAIRLFKSAVEAWPQSVEALNRLGDAQLLAHKTEEAIVTYRKAYQLNPKEAWTSLGLASAYLRQKKYSSALQYAEKAAREAPEHPWALQMVGECYFANRRYLESEAALRKSLSAVPENCGPYPTLSAACVLLGKVAEGKSVLDEAKRRGCEIPQETSELLEKSIDKVWWLGTPGR